MASKKNKSFADQAKKIMSKYALRPDDNASKTAMNLELKVLKDEQEMERQQMAQEAMETLNSLGMSPQAPGMMGDQMSMQQGQGMPQQMPPQQAYGGNLYAEGGILNTTEDTPKKRERSSKVKDFIAGLKFRNRDVSQPFLGQEAFTALQALKDYGYAGDPAVITSMLRGKGNEVFQEGSWHNKGRAFDISAKEDSEKLINWTNSEQGQKWLSDFGIDYIDETSDAKRKAVGSKGTAPHHHFEFEKKYKKLDPNIDPERLSQLESEFTKYKDNRNLVNMKDYPGFQSEELPPVFIEPAPYQPDLRYLAEQESTAIPAYGGDQYYGAGGPYKEDIPYKEDMFNRMNLSSGEIYELWNQLGINDNTGPTPIDPDGNVIDISATYGPRNSYEEDYARSMISNALGDAPIGTKAAGYGDTAVSVAPTNRYDQNENEKAYGGNMRKYEFGDYLQSDNSKDFSSQFDYPKKHPTLSPKLFSSPEGKIMEDYGNKPIVSYPEDYYSSEPDEDKNKEENTFDGKMDTGDYITAGIGALPDLAGLAYAAKKPEKRGRMSTLDETFDDSPYNRALALGNEGISNISRGNPNAALSNQIAGNTSLNTGIAAERADAEQQMEARNIQRQMGVDQFNLSQDERDRQAMDARMLNLFEHGKGMTDAYTGVKGDKDKMAMEAQIANMLGTDNYTIQKNADGSLSFIPKKDIS